MSIRHSDIYPRSGLPGRRGAGGGKFYRSSNTQHGQLRGRRSGSEQSSIKEYNSRRRRDWRPPPVPIYKRQRTSVISFRKRRRRLTFQPRPPPSSPASQPAAGRRRQRVCLGSARGYSSSYSCRLPYPVHSVNYSQYRETGALLNGEVVR